MLEGGGMVNYTERGELESVQFSEAITSCEDVNDPSKWQGTPGNLPKGVSIVGGGKRDVRGWS